MDKHIKALYIQSVLIIIIIAQQTTVLNQKLFFKYIERKLLVVVFSFVHILFELILKIVIIFLLFIC